VVTFASSGHTQSSDPRWLWVLVDTLHLSAMIIWLGGVVVLLVAALSRQHRALPAGEGFDFDEADREADREQLAAGLPVFSRVAMACIATLAVTGTIQAWREVGALDALTNTRYGQLVLVKVALFCAILGLGYLARRAVLRSVAGAAPAAEPALSASTLPSGVGSRSATALSSRVMAPAGSALPAGLSRTLLVEVVIGALVLAATAVLVSQPPGKVALAAQRSEPRHALVRVNATTQASVDVTPGVHGNVRIAVRLSGGTRPIAVTASASLPAQKLGPIPVPLQAAGPGSYTSSSDVLLPVAGTWELTLTVQTSEFDSTVALARVKVS
jgi:copper transport protein